VLTPLAQDCLDDRTDDTVIVPALRHDRPEPGSLLTAVAYAHTQGAAVNWPALFAGPAGPSFTATGAESHATSRRKAPGIREARRIDLPTYAFQRQRYWLDNPAPPAPATNPGREPPGHPLLGAAVELADTNGLLFTGRLSRHTHAWLAEHVVAD